MKRQNTSRNTFGAQKREERRSGLILGFSVLCRLDSGNSLEEARSFCSMFFALVSASIEEKMLQYLGFCIAVVLPKKR